MNPEFVRRFKRNRAAVGGLVVLVLVGLVALTAPWLVSHGPWDMVQRPFLAPFEEAGLPLGSDALGRDVAAGLAYGARVSMIIGLVATAMALQGIPDKPIVLTGALQPAIFAQTDAIFNIGCALGAVQSKPPGVYIAMNGEVFDAHKVVKNVKANRFEHVA